MASCVRMPPRLMEHVSAEADSLLLEGQQSPLKRRTLAQHLHILLYECLAKADRIRQHRFANIIEGVQGAREFRGRNKLLAESGVSPVVHEFARE